MNVEKKLIKYFSKNYIGSPMWLDRISKEVKVDSGKVKDALVVLSNKKIVEIEPIWEVGNPNIIGMRVIDFNMPLKEGFFKSKLFVGISTAVVILFLTQYVVPNVDDCFNRPKYARSIYTELLGNMKEVDKAIDSLAKRGNYVFENAKFSTAAYDKYYKPGFFGNSSLDQQLDNFYNAVKRFNPSYKIADFKRMEEHGRQSLQMLSKIGKIRDYDETKKTIKVKDENVVENVISADSSGASSDNAASATTIKQK